MALRIFLVLIFSLVTATSSVAQFGTRAEIIRAAEENREPAYIRNLMEELSKKLSVLAQKKGIGSPSQMLAWLLTMRVSTSLAYTEAANVAEQAAAYVVWAKGKSTWEKAADAASDAADNSEFYAAWKAAGEAAEGLGQIKAWDEAWRAVKAATINAPKDILVHAARKAIEEAVTEALINGATIELIGRIAYRASEWAVLNNFFENFTAIFEPTFDAALKELISDQGKNPFESVATWQEFRETQFSQLAYEARVFVAPWLDVLDSLVFIQYQARTALMSLDRLAQRDFNMFQTELGFPREIMALIMGLAIHAPVPRHQ